MKKFFTCLFMICAFALSSCSNDSDEDPTTYSLEFNSTSHSSIITTNIMLFEYNSSNETIKSSTVENCTEGLKKVFTADDNAVKVKVYVKLETSSATKNRWIDQVYYLKKNSNTRITIDDNTIVCIQEP